VVLRRGDQPGVVMQQAELKPGAPLVDQAVVCQTPRNAIARA
jgi:hypothetical protein